MKLNIEVKSALKLAQHVAALKDFSFHMLHFSNPTK